MWSSVHQRMLGSPQSSAAACSDARSSNDRAAAIVAVPVRRDAEDRQVLRRLQPELLPGELERVQPVLPRQFDPATPERDEGDRQVILRHFEPVLGGRLVRRVGVRGRLSQVPAQYAIQESPQRARAARGSSRSRHSAYSVSSSVRARSRDVAGAAVFTSTCVASCTNRSPPSAAARSRGCPPRPGA